MFVFLDGGAKPGLMVGSFLYDAKTGSFEQRPGGAAPGRHAEQARAELERLRLTATGWRIAE